MRKFSVTGCIVVAKVRCGSVASSSVEETTASSTVMIAALSQGRTRSTRSARSTRTFGTSDDPRHERWVISGTLTEMLPEMFFLFSGQEAGACIN